MAKLVSLKKLQQDFLPDLCQKTIYNLARSGRIRGSYRVGARWMFDASEVVASIKAQQEPASTPADGGKAA